MGKRPWVIAISIALNVALLSQSGSGLYRMFDVDYEDDGFFYDARQQGWQLGLTWAF